jgi:hypothetical protein
MLYQLSYLGTAWSQGTDDMAWCLTHARPRIKALQMAAWRKLFGEFMAR